MNVDRPIPQHADSDFRQVSILECDEPLIELRPCKLIYVCPAYHLMGFATAESSIHLRSGAMEALQLAAKSLPRGMSIIVYDGLRSLQTQKEIADRFAGRLATIPITDDERSTTIARFVAPLPNSEAEYRRSPPAHATAGAADVGLVDSDGNLLDLGAEFDQFDDTAASAYYEKVCSALDCSPVDQARRDRRRILYWAMIEAGFAPYGPEVWHFEFGTQRAAAFYGRASAEYGPVAPWPQNGWQ